MQNMEDSYEGKSCIHYVFKMSNNPDIIVVLIYRLNKQRRESILKFKDKGGHIAMFTATAEEEGKYCCLFLHKKHRRVWNQYIHYHRLP